MINIVKEAKKILWKIEWKNHEEKLQKIKPKSQDYYIINTAELLNKHKLQIYYENIDWLTAEIKSNNQNIVDITTQLLTTYNHKRDIEKTEKHIEFFKYKKILDKFYLLNLWAIFGWQLQVYWIYDIDKNKIWSFVYKNPVIQKNNYNAFTYVELTWLFFKCYPKYLDLMLEHFGVDRESNWILKRLDYCVDFIWIEVPEILDFLCDVHKKQKIQDYNWLTKSDLEKLKEWNKSMKFWKTETWRKFTNNSNSLVIYDKWLDIVQNYLKRQIEWKNPYQDYIDSENSITRIELKKTTSAFAKIQDNSINTMFTRIRPLYFDYLKRYFICDFSLLTWQKISLNGQKINLAKQQKEINILHSLNMAKTYLKNIDIVLWRKALFKFIFELYPDIEQTSSLDVMDEFDAYDFIQKLFDK